MPIASEPPEVLREYSQDEELQPFLHVNAGDRTWYITMNLTQPPFDDIHVRKAANFVMDKEGLRRAWGGPLFGEIANHIVPDVMLNDTLSDYVPYPSEGDAGDAAAAMEEMKLSKYDTDQDGICDAPECKDVLYLTATDRLRQDMVPPTVASLEKIGITLNVRSVEDAYTPIQTVNENIPISGRAGWGKDYPDSSTFMVLFDSRSIIPTGNVNYSLVGATCEQLGEIQGWRGRLRGSPERGRRHRRVQPGARAGRAHHLLGRSRQEAHGGGRAVGAVPGRLGGPDHGPDRHAMGVRSVRRYDRVRPRGRGRVSAVREQHDRRAAPDNGAALRPAM